MPLNYKRLRYFWAVVQWGTLRAAAERLHVSEPTISVQIKKLERWLGRPLFRKEGRRLVPTEFGRVVYQYADEIFAVGEELVDVARERAEPRGLPLRVGVTETIPKMLVAKLVDPVLAIGGFRVEVSEGSVRGLVGRLMVHDLDLVLSDIPVAEDPTVNSYVRLLGRTEVSVLATPALRTHLEAEPDGLEDAPWLLPGEDAPIRQDLERWFRSEGIRPRIIGEIQDSALIKSLAQQGWGLMAVPSVVEADVCAQYGLEPLLHLPDTEERYYAVTVERRISHPGVRTIVESGARAFEDARSGSSSRRHGAEGDAPGAEAPGTVPD